MKLSISNILLHEHLEIDLHPGVNIVTGQNSAGKSSVAVALAALAAQEANPMHLPATDRKLYLRDGSHDGQASLTVTSQNYGLCWSPVHLSVTSTLTKDPKALSAPHAVGLSDFVVKRTEPERAKLWEDLFLPANPKHILQGYIPEAHLDSMMKEIERNGWKSAMAVYEEKRKAAKARWQTVTQGGRYSDEKAAHWVPKTWREDLEGESLESLQAKLQDRVDVVSQLISCQAVSQAEIDRARGIRDHDIPEANKNIAALRTRAEELQKEHGQKSADIKATKSVIEMCQTEITNAETIVNAKPQFECPVCHSGLSHANGTLHVWECASEEHMTMAHEKIGQQKGESVKMQTLLHQQNTEFKVMVDTFSKIRAEIYGYEGQVTQLESQSVMADSKAVTGASDHDMMKAQTAREEARQDVEAKEAMIEAKRAFDNVIELDVMVKALSPTGARYTEMQKSLTLAQKGLDRIAALSGWGLVVVSPNYSIKYNGRPVQLCAVNEQLKTQISLQVAFALICKSTMIVLDAVDLLQDDSWTGLESLMRRLCEKNPHMVVVLCGTNLRPLNTAWPVTVL